MPAPHRGLDYWLFKLVGSFCKKHAVTEHILLCARLLLFVSKWFQVYFNGLDGLLFTFPSRYWFTIGDIDYLALPDSSGCFLPGCHSRQYLRKIARSIKLFLHTGLLPSMVPLSRVLLLIILPKCSPSANISVNNKLSTEVLPTL